MRLPECNLDIMSVMDRSVGKNITAVSPAPSLHCTSNPAVLLLPLHKSLACYSWWVTGWVDGEGGGIAAGYLLTASELVLVYMSCKPCHGCAMALHCLNDANANSQPHQAFTLETALFRGVILPQLFQLL